MTTTANLKAIVPTPTAKNAVAAKGADVTALQQQLLLKTGELRVLLAQLIALHPGGGGDAANLAALNAELALLV